MVMEVTVKYVIVENSMVVNVAVADEPLANNWVASEAAQIGWLYDGETFTAPPPAPEPVPAVVSMRQARLALSRAGLLANAETAIAGMTGAAGDEARIEWEYATELRRDHPLIVDLGVALNLEPEDVDDLFRQAAQIL